MTDPRTFEIKGTILKETEKGLLLSLPDGRQEWFPKTTITSSYNSNHSVVQDFLIVKWILEEKGIIRKSKNPNVIGNSASEEYLINKLQQKGIDDFTSFKEIQNFNNDFSKVLKSSTALESKRLNSITESLRSDEDKLRKELEEKNFDKPFKKDINQIKKIEKKRISIEKNFGKSVEKKVSQLYKAQKIIQKNQQYYESAKGEAAVIKELRKLPETYYILNEVELSFYRSIRWKKYGEYVKSCKIDHVVVGPTGIFLFDTQNWSPQTKQTAKVPPHKQIQRAGYIFFIHMMDRFETKYPLYQILVTFRQLPQIPYDYVARLTIQELVDHILSREGLLNPSDVLKIVEWLRSSPYIFNAKHVFLKLKF